ncbi:MAG: PepSY domain-containing protein [Actinomycetota bacterium]|nr:PepSY domain-containing protein [Actinomycetota bacterium]
MLWRLHFLGGFLAAPVVLSLALTGILFAWNPQIETVLHRDTLTATAPGPDHTLTAQVTAARGTHPGWAVTTVVPAAEGGEQTTGVTLNPPGAPDAEFGPAPGAVTVYVDPASTRVTGQIEEAKRPGEWLRSLHSSWRLGPAAEPVTELAASWVLVSLLTGVYLWWPRTRRGLQQALRPRLHRQGRRRWRWVHSSIGMVLLVPLLVLIGSGLSWTTYAGAWIDVARTQLDSATPAVSTSLERSDGALTHEHHAGHDGADGSAVAAMGIDQVAAAASRTGLGRPVEITPAARDGEAWTVARQDSRWPVEPTTAAVDPATGTVVDLVTWEDYPLLAKATTLGIAFHEGELFGLANQIGLTALAAGLIVLVLAGYRMWWLRRPAGGLGTPSPVGPLLRRAPITVLIGFGLLLVLLPTLGVAFVLLLILEQAVRFVRGRKGAPSAV